MMMGVVADTAANVGLVKGPAMNNTTTRDETTRNHTLSELKRLRELATAELGSIHELIRDRCPQPAVTRLRELGARLEREAKMIDAVRATLER